MGSGPPDAPSLAVALADEEEGLLTCVHCGFCLPVCPTYTRLGDENDSPRGRLYLMRAVVEGRLDPGDSAFQIHIDRCLGCRACEPVCPSGVPYGRLLELAREEGARARSPGFVTRIFLKVFGSRGATKAALAAGRALRATGIPALAARVLPSRGRAGELRLGLAMLAASAPAPGRTWAARSGAAEATAAGGATSVGEATPAGGTTSVGEATPTGGTTSVGEATLVGGTTPAGGTMSVGEVASPEQAGGARVGAEAGAEAGPTVALLRGCVQEGLFGRVNRATARVLEANGCTVRPAPRQGCCGAIHAHGGDLEAARELARRNVDAFEATGADLIVVNAAGCGAAMKDYGHLLAGDETHAERARAMGERVRDVSEVLADLGPRPGAPLPVRVAYDAPCHLLHAQQVQEPPARVLGAVPELELVPLENAEECCGGAGIYGITHPDLGGRIGGDKIDAVEASGADVVTTGNPGCIMQIGAGLRMRGSDVSVVHPVEILDESYRRAGVYA